MNKVKETKSAGGVVLNRKREVLVVNQDGKSWSLPKGHIDPGEDALAAAKREIYEESGVTDLELIKEFEKYQRYKIGKNGGEDKTEVKTIFMFLFNTSQEDLNPVDDHNPEARWLDKNEVADLLTHPKDKEFFLKVIEQINV